MPALLLANYAQEVKIRDGSGSAASTLSRKPSRKA